MKTIRAFFVLILLVLANGSAKAVTIFLTFDDGPGAGTEFVLDLLAGELELQTKPDGKEELVKAPAKGPKQAFIPATFFLKGKEGTGQKALFERIRKDKHQTGNHTFNHIFGDAPANEKAYETAFGKTAFDSPEKKANFAEHFAKNTKHFAGLISQPNFSFSIARLPGDGRNFAYLRKEIEDALGMKHFGWDVEFTPNGTFPNREKPEQNDLTRDWKGLPVAVSKLGTGGLPKDGQIILFHEQHWAGAKQVTFAKIIGILRGEGYTFKTLN